MKRKLAKKILAAAMCGAIATGTLAGCGAGDGGEGTSDATSGETETAETDTESGAADIMADNARLSGGEKQETVYVKADATGSVTEITAEEILENSTDADVILDYSELDEIKNTEGDEEFAQTGTQLLWENHGEDISYEGTGNAELPASVSITYTLDGQEISPDELAGRSGHLVMRFDYTNNTSETVSVDGEDVTTQVPFVMVTLVALPDDVFDNVETENASTTTLSGTNMAVGLALPGWDEQLGLSKLELTKDIELAQYIEISADVTDFELDFTATVAAAGILGSIDSEMLEDASSMTDGMDELAEGSQELADGTDKLYDGMDEFGGYLGQIADGAEALAEGIGSLESGAGSLGEAESQLVSGAKSLSDGLAALEDGISSYESLIKNLSSVSAALGEYVKELSEYRDKANSAIKTAQDKLDAIPAEGLTDTQKTALKDAKDSLSELGEVPQIPSALSSMSGGSADSAFSVLSETISALSAGSKQLYDGLVSFGDGLEEFESGAAALADGAGELASGSEEIDKAFDEVLEGVGELRDGFKEFNEEGIQEITDAFGDDLANTIKALRAMQKADESYKSYGGIAEGQDGSTRFIIETEGIEK